MGALTLTLSQRARGPCRRCPSDRRALRALVEGVHAGDGGGRFRGIEQAKPKQQFTVGILDDVTHLSLDYDPEFSTEKSDVVRAVFFGLGSDGTGGREPQLRQNRRREYAAACPGLFRLRLAQGRLGDHLARPFQPAADQGLVPGAPRQFRGLPPVPFPGADRRALDGRSGGDLPGEQPIRPERGLGPSARGSAEADHRQEAEVLRGRRVPGHARDGHGRADQHDHADAASSSWRA